MRKYKLHAFTCLGIMSISVPAMAAIDERIKLGEYIQSVKLGGDVRLRQESFDKKTPGQVDQHRQRFRLRVGLDIALPYFFEIKTRFASGTGEQQSTNQSFDNLASQKQFWIDRAFLQWMPEPWMRLAGGRMANPFWLTPSTDIVWDEDVNPEGFGQSFEILLAGNMRVFANALQMIVDEDSGDNADQWMFGEQVGADFMLPFDWRFRVAGAYYDWKNENVGSFSANKANEGNRRLANGILINRFGIKEGSAELSSWVGPIPVSLYGTVVRNAHAAMHVNPREDKGWQAGLRLGRAMLSQSWEVAYLHKYVQTDAVVADIADSDFGDGGSNREGDIYWAAYNPVEYLQVKAKYFSTFVIDETLPPRTDSIDRFQLDLSVRF